MRHLILAVSLLFACVGLANAADPVLSIVSEPASVPAGYRDDKASGRVRVMTTAESGLPAIYLRAFPLKLGNETASITFPGNSGKSWIELPAGTEQKLDVPFDVTGLEVSGTYEGQIEVMPQGKSSAAVSTKVVVVRADPGFALTVGGSAYKDGQISFTTADPKVPATFTVQIPATGRKRELEVAPKAPFDKVVAVSPDQRFTVSPGETKIIYLLPKSDMPLGISTGALTVRDANRNDLATEVFVSATRLGSVEWRTFILFAFVFVGAVVSMLLNNIFPVSLANRRTRQALTNIETDIRSSGNVTPALQAALFADSARVRLLNGSFGWYTTTKGELMQQVATLVKALQDNVATANEISAQRLRSDSNSIPVRCSLQAEERLLEAERALVANKPDLAKKAVDEAKTLIDSGSGTAVLNDLRTQLVKDIDALIAASATVLAARPAAITSLVTKLTASKPNLAAMPAQQLLAAERDHYIAWTFVNDFEPNAAGNADLANSETDFLAALTNATTKTDTRLLIQLAQKGLAPQDVENALTQRPPRIDSDNEAIPYQMSNFRLVFGNPALAVDAVRRICDYKWDFGDNTPSPNSDFCRHFYLSPPEPGDLMERAARRIGRKFGLGVRTGHPYTVTVTVTTPVSTGPGVAFTKAITVQRSRRRMGAIGIEVATFFISFFIAVCAAYGTQYATLPTADTVSVFITAFLFGFGLDQIRDRAATQR